MPLDPKKLADDIKKELGHEKDKTSEESIGLAKSLIEELQQNGIVVIAPGGVTGTAPSSGGPLTKGKATGGKILGILGPSLASRMQLNMGFPSTTPQLLQMANGLILHFSTVAEIIFDPGGIVGVCANSPSSPGPLAGAGSKGKIIKLVVNDLAELMAAGLGGKATKEVKGVSKAIINHLQTNAEVTFASGSVVGVCSSGGGPVQAGAAAGGRIF